MSSLSTHPVFILVIYDIADDARRNEMAIALKRLGLTRVQRSAFIGPSNFALVSDVKNVSKKIIDLESDNVQIYPLTQASYNMRLVIGKELFSDGGFEGGYLV